MGTFSLFDLLLCVGVSQGIFLAVSLRLLPDRNAEANRVLSWTLLIATLMLIGRVSVYRMPFQWAWSIAGLADTTIFLFGPFIYLYVRRLSFGEATSYKLKWYHFTPAMLHFIYWLWSMSIGYEGYKSLYQSGALRIPFLIIEFSGIVSILSYCLHSFRTLHLYRRRVKEEVAIDQGVLKFLGLLTSAVILIGLFWLISFCTVNLIGNISLGFDYYTVMWVLVPVFIYVVGYYSLVLPNVFRIPFRSDIRPEKDRLKPTEIHQLQKRLDYYMQSEKVYQESSLTLTELAGKLNTSPNNLSWLLNKVYSNSFYEYINTHRVNALIEKIKADEHQRKTLLALAMEVGYNSKSTFNKSFKSITGLTPSQYIKSKNVA